jgi:hypothetical protein
VKWVDRLGAALLAPKKAFAEADAGRGGAPDAALLLALAFVCAELRVLVQAIWTALVVGLGAGLSLLLGRLLDFAGDALVVWGLSGLAITLAAGRKRSPSRDFDLAGVAFVPYLVLRLILDWVPAPRTLEDGVAVAAAALWVVLAVWHARRSRA